MKMNLFLLLLFCLGLYSCQKTIDWFGDINGELDTEAPCFYFNSDNLTHVTEIGPLHHGVEVEFEVHACDDTEVETIVVSSSDKSTKDFVFQRLDIDSPKVTVVGAAVDTTVKGPRVYTVKAMDKHNNLSTKRFTVLY